MNEVFFRATWEPAKCMVFVEFSANGKDTQNEYFDLDKFRHFVEVLGKEPVKIGEMTFISESPVHTARIREYLEIVLSSIDEHIERAKKTGKSFEEDKGLVFDKCQGDCGKEFPTELLIQSKSGKVICPICESKEVGQSKYMSDKQNEAAFFVASQWLTYSNLKSK